MATKYSGRTGSVGGRTKLVVTYAPSNVKNGTASVKVTAKFYYESRYRTQDSVNTAKLSGGAGSWSGSMSINGTSKLIKTITKTVATSYTATKRISVTGTLSGVEASPGNHKVTAVVTVPKRPVARPKPPTNVKAELISGDRIRTTWSGHPTTAQPVTSYTVQYRQLIGATWSGWRNVATVKGKSHTSNPVIDNRSYQRRVRANNGAGSSAWVTSNYIRMKPDEPRNVRARVKSSGSDIEVTWDLNNPAESAVFSYRLQRRV